MGIELRPYQSQAVGGIFTELTKHRSTLAVLATGLGKTVIFSAVAKRFADAGCRTLILAHRRELLEQAAATMQRFGLTTGFEQASDCVSLHAMPSVVLATVQTLRGARLERFQRNTFGLVVVDEAHHAVSKSYRTVLEHFADAKVLGVTATPDRADEVALGNVFESTAYRMTISHGIKGGWLSPVELRSVAVDSLDISHVRTVAGELDRSQLEAELTRDAVLHEIAKPLAELTQGRKTLAFVAGVAQAHALAEVLRGYGVVAEAVDGTMGPEQRAAVRMRHVSGATQVVANAALWTEGYDCPEVSCVALIRPTRSRSLLCQMIGRGTRLAPGKTACLVLDFVPSRAPSIRLSSPADALAGRELPEAIAAQVRASSTDAAGDVLGLVAAAYADAEQKRHALRCDVIYRTARLAIDDLLAVANDMAPTSSWAHEPATDRQIEALQSSGFQVENITRGQADALFGILKQRREAGLCTLKQAKRLRAYGLRDDVSFHEAQKLIDAISHNGWRPPPWVCQQYAAM
jgi:superfamily II DNA or RNA helicase